MASNAPRVHPQQALAVYVEPLAVGRRVVVFGDASLGLATRVAELGARGVCVWDPDARRARLEAEHASPGVIVRALLVDEIDERDGAFDLAIVPDLELFDDARELLALVRRLVGPDGVALVVAPNRDGTGGSPAFDYYELFDLVAREFDDVIMIAQLPFYGVALAELGEQGSDEPPSVTVDTQLAGTDRSPEAYVALASQRGVRLDPYAIVELTALQSLAADPGDAERLRVALAQAGLRAEALEAQGDELRARLADAERVARAALSLDEALNDQSARAAELENLLAERTRQLALLSDEMERTLVGTEAERIASNAQLEALALRAHQAERALAASGPDLVLIGEGHAREIGRMEEALRDRAQALRALEAELVRRERMVRELIDAVEEASRTGAPLPTSEQEGSSERDALVEENAGLRHKLDGLALELARREGEALASAWSIAELERRLETATEIAPSADGPTREQGRATGAVENSHGVRSEAVGTDPTVDARLAAALDERDVLRRALAQEHEARLRAESGQKPPSTQGDVQHQD